MVETVLKSVCATEIFTIDWSSELGTQSVATSVWTVPVDLVSESETIDGQLTTIELSGGVAGQLYLVLNTITITSSTEIRCDTLPVLVVGG